MKKLSDIVWRGKVAVLRADLNAPMNNGCMTDDSRLRAALPTINFILQNGGATIVLSHLGRPVEQDKKLSLKPVAAALTKLLKKETVFVPQLFSPSAQNRPPPGAVWLLENTRFNRGEENNDDALAKKYAALGDVFVMDAFASAHRRQASVVGVAKFCDDCCIGLLAEKEIAVLSEVAENAKRPLLGIFGGAKISGKLAAMLRMQKICDSIIVGGGVANTLLAAKKIAVGKSLTETGMENESLQILARDNVVLPPDVVVARSPDDKKSIRTIAPKNIRRDEMILDIGGDAQKMFAMLIAKAKTILWNGPVGLFEKQSFAAGTRAIGRAIGESDAFSVAGGGDTLAAIAAFGLADNLSYISTGGGAMLEYLAGNSLPGLVEINKQAVNRVKINKQMLNPVNRQSKILTAR